MSHAKTAVAATAMAGTMLFATGAAARAPAGELRCPEAGCPVDLVIHTGTVEDPKTGRKYFLDFPSDVKPGETLTFVLNLHGGGSFGNWQRHYFPIVDYVDKYRLVVATPNAPPRVWQPSDDAHLQNIVEQVYERFGRENIGAFWLAGHSQGGATSRRIVCSDYFAPKVTGFLSLSGGRVGGQPERAPDFGPPAPRGGGAGGPSPEMRAQLARIMAQPLNCDFSHIYTTGEHEIVALPATSDWAEKYGCAARERRPDIVDTKAGYIYDSGRQDPATKSWGRLPGPGRTEVYAYPGCRDGRVVADLVRIDKGHTEGLEPKVTEEIVKLMVSAR
ncbi:MAG: hypothetical protein ACK41C_13525 [Phenylobacterium sp.]|uniref:hypothetical protein n=1 Tax=Phenylobacterium sp. TaxID=1871053 RepID=UPI00391D9BDE